MNPSAESCGIAAILGSESLTKAIATGGLNRPARSRGERRRDFPGGPAPRRAPATNSEIDSIRAGKLGEVTAQHVDFVRVARAGRSHGIIVQECPGFARVCSGRRCCSPTPGHRKTGAMLGDDLVERLVPSKRVGRHDRGLVLPHDLDQVADQDARRRLLERRQPVDQEVPLVRRDLGAENTRSEGARAASSASSSACHW